MARGIERHVELPGAPGTPANARAYSPAKGTNRGKERSGNDCQSGYTPFAALARTHPEIPAASSPLFVPRNDLFEREWRWSTSWPRRSKLKFPPA
jgi:hypothetical protein